MRDRMGSRQGETGVPLPTVALRYTLTPQGQRLSLSQTAHGARSHGAPGLRRYDAARQPRSRVLYGIRSIAGRVHSRRGPALGGLYLRKATDFSQMRCVYRCESAQQSVHSMPLVVCALGGLSCFFCASVKGLQLIKHPDRPMNDQVLRQELHSFLLGGVALCCILFFFL